MKALKQVQQPTAEQRTISLFTGMTDLDAPDGAARDGSRAEERRDPRPRPRPKWLGGGGSWYTEDRRGNPLCRVTREANGYRAWARGRELGTFATIGEAGRACEEA